MVSRISGRNKLKAYWFIVLLTLMIATNAFSQTDTLRQNDSLNATLINEYGQKLKQFEQQRIQDSIHKIELELQISQLKSGDDLRRKELEKQLDKIKEDELVEIANKKARIDSLRSTAKSYPVLGLFNDTLFLIYGRMGSFTAGERADIITQRIKKLKSDYSFSKSSLTIVESELIFDIANGENIIMSISDNDAMWNNVSRRELAENYREIITASILKYREASSITTLIKEIGLASLVILLLGILIYFTTRLFNWTILWIKRQEGRSIKGINLRSYTLLDASTQVNFLISINKVVKWIFILLLVYIALPIIFGFFPWTQNFAQTLFGYVYNPLRKIASGVWDYLPNLFTIIVIVIVFRYLLKGVHFLKDEVEKGKLSLPGFYPDWANPTFQILRVVLYAFMFVMMFPYLPGSDSPVFKGVSVFLGFLFTFGSAGSLSNIIAGIVLTYMRLFKLGDRVKIGDIMGDVIEKSMLVTRIKTIKNEIISIPNSTIMSSHTINYSQEAEGGNGLILYTTVTIGYDVPWKNIHEALINAAGRTKYLLENPKPFVLQTSLDDFYVSYQINAFTQEPRKQAEIYSQLHQNIQDCCNEAGIEILSPHYRSERDGNMTTIPGNYLDKNYKPPSFNIKIEKDEK